MLLKEAFAWSITTAKVALDDASSTAAIEAYGVIIITALSGIYGDTVSASGNTGGTLKVVA